MKLLTSKDGDLLSYFDNINETDTSNNSLNDKLINSHTVEANRRKIRGQLQLENVFGFCKTFKRISKKRIAFNFQNS